MRETSFKGRKVKHRLDGRTGIILGLTHYSRAEKFGAYKVKWLCDDGSLSVEPAHDCEFCFCDEEPEGRSSDFVEFIKSVADWPQPEVWFDREEQEIVVDWSRSPIRVASVFFGEDLRLVRWSILFNGEPDGGRGSEIPGEVLAKIKDIALDY